MQYGFLIHCDTEIICATNWNRAQSVQIRAPGLGRVIPSSKVSLPVCVEMNCKELHRLCLGLLHPVEVVGVVHGRGALHAFLWVVVKELGRSLEEQTKAAAEHTHHYDTPLSSGVVTSGVMR